jgi:3-oxoacyl-[acyl-carrier protein] reductase
MGRAVALSLADRGALLVLNDLRREALADTAALVAAVAETPLLQPADVTDAAAVTSMFAAVDDAVGHVDIVVNNAGVLRGSRFADISEAEWDLVVHANLKSTFLVSQQAIARMRRTGWGRIVNMSSTAGKNVSTLGGAHYTAAKAGILGLTRALASEVARDGITVNAVCPGLIDTDMVRDSVDAAAIARYEQSFPINRLGRPDEVAAMIAYLCSDDAAYVTGASLDINGGDLMI